MELLCRSGSRINTEASKYPGNNVVPLFVIRIHKSQNYHSRGSPAYQIAKANSQKHNQSNSICPQTSQGHGLVDADTPEAAARTWWALSEYDVRQTNTYCLPTAVSASVGA